MKLAFCLFKYFPYGGMQRDFLRIARACRRRGHEIHVYTLEWQGAPANEFDVNIVAARGITNHQRYSAFSEFFAGRRREYDATIGFNKMPGLDVYYAADSCFKERLESGRLGLYALSRRYNRFVEFERAVFEEQARTEILLLSSSELEVYTRHYNTPRARFHLMPPPPLPVAANRESARQEVRVEFAIAEPDKLVLMVGSGFKTKGLDRALAALSTLPRDLLQRTHFLVIGEDNPRDFAKAARRLRVSMRLLGGRDDVPRFLAAADLLLHPAYRENTGTILLEAMASGVPVLTTDTCGFAFHVREARGGHVVASPFKQEDLNARLLEMLTSEQNFGENGVRYIASLAFPSLAETAADIIEAKALANREQRD